MGVDCPEMSQEFGQEAQAFLANCLLQKEVVANNRGKDRLKNYISVESRLACSTLGLPQATTCATKSQVMSFGCI